LGLRRFADSLAVTPTVPTGSARVEIPSDRSSHPWQAELVTTSRLELCP
jgi:hypothetical protein